MTTPSAQVERVARAIYKLFEYDVGAPAGSDGKPVWVEGGNSLKQDEARRLARAAIEAHEAALADSLAAKDQAYLERNHLVAAVARLYPSGIRETDIPGWSEDWHGCVYIDLPSGQISYHYHNSHAYLFAALPPFEGEWDGHDKDIVHERLVRISKPDALALVEAARLVAEGTAISVGTTPLRMQMLRKVLAVLEVGDVAKDASTAKETG